MKLRETVARFLYGRNGPDKLYSVCLIASIILMFVNLFVKNVVLEIISFLLLSYAIFRLLSRNVYKRQEENRKFLRLCTRVRNWFSTTKSRLTDRSHAYRKCPNCKSQLRLPRKKGKHTVRCPRCSATFDVKI
ncbi:MAG: hypothetical protein KBS45_05285 [Clostridiales bacterium]|nr:hypothetical protein [Candidatus Coliplasma caballi]